MRNHFNQCLKKLVLERLSNFPTQGSQSLSSPYLSHAPNSKQCGGLPPGVDPRDRVDKGPSCKGQLPIEHAYTVESYPSSRGLRIQTWKRIYPKIEQCLMVNPFPKKKKKKGKKKKGKK
jgi:hypothetical protein